MGEPLTWSAAEHPHIERGSDWYWALGIIAISGALTSLLFSNILFALLILMAAVTLGLVASHPSQMVEFSVHDKGLDLGEETHLFRDMIGFWIEEDEQGATLMVDTPKILAPDVIVPIVDVDPEEIRNRFLAAEVPEVKMSAPLPYKVLEFFGF